MGKPLSAAHKAAISKALKGKKRGKNPASQKRDPSAPRSNAAQRKVVEHHAKAGNPEARAALKPAPGTNIGVGGIRAEARAAGATRTADAAADRRAAREIERRREAFRQRRNS